MFGYILCNKISKIGLRGVDHFKIELLQIVRF